MLEKIRVELVLSPKIIVTLVYKTWNYFYVSDCRFVRRKSDSAVKVSPVSKIFKSVSNDHDPCYKAEDTNHAFPQHRTQGILWASVSVLVLESNLGTSLAFSCVSQG